VSADLPFIDEFDAVMDAPAADVFVAVARRMGRSMEGPLARAASRALGCLHRGASYTVPPVEGQETNGFRVVAVEAPAKLVMEGEHRFARYRLSFFIEPLAPNRTRVSARTEAAFPGISGTFYRALVIGSGGHGIVVRRMLATVAARAERREKGR
jgi:hypothetical protein